MTDTERDLLARVFADVQAAVSSAKKLYPDAPAEIVRLAAADFLVHVRELRRLNDPLLVPAVGRAAAGQPARNLGGGTGVPRSCPICSGPMRDQQATKRGNQPDLKCANRACSGAIWLDHASR